MYLLDLLTILALAFIFVSATKDFASGLERVEAVEKELELIEKYNFRVSLPLKLDDDKKRFECWGVPESGNAGEEQMKDLGCPDMFTIMKHSYYSIEDLCIKSFSPTMQLLYRRLSYTFNDFPLAFNEAFLSDLDAMESFFKSTMNLFIELFQLSNSGGLTDDYLASLKTYKNIEVDYSFNELTLAYPSFFSKLPELIKKNLSGDEKNIRALYAAISESRLMYKEGTEDFRMVARARYTTLLKRYCDAIERQELEVLNIQSKVLPSETYHETNINMLMSKKKKKSSFNCRNRIPELRKSTYRKLIELQKEIASALEQFCSSKNEIPTAAEKKFKTCPSERSLYVGPVFLSRLQECIPSSLPEILKSLSASTSAMESFSNDVNRVVGMLMEAHQMQKLMDLSILKSQSNAVTLQLREDGVVNIKWKAILDTNIVDKTLDQFKEQSDSDSSQKTKSSLNSLKNILFVFKKLQESHIRYVLYDSCVKA